MSSGATSLVEAVTSSIVTHRTSQQLSRPQCEISDVHLNAQTHLRPPALTKALRYWLPPPVYRKAREDQR